MANNPGTGDELGGQYYILREAECEDEDDSGGDSGDDGSDTDDGFLDDDDCEQGDSLALLQEQQRQDSDRVEGNIKRKLFGSPQVPDTVDEAQCLSPRLQDVCITQRSKRVRKQLQFGNNEVAAATGEIRLESDQVQGEGGHRMIVVAQVHRESTPAPTPESVMASPAAEAADAPPVDLNSSGDSGVVDTTPEGAGRHGRMTAGEAVARARETFNKTEYVTDLLRSAHIQAVVLGQLKAAFEVAFSDLTRPFKSNKSMSNEWVVGCTGVEEVMLIASRQLLQEHCDYILIRDGMAGRTPCAMMHLVFIHEKNRDSIKKMLKCMLCVHEEQIVANPPRTTSVLAALHWYHLGLSPGERVFKHGAFPGWITEQTVSNHIDSVKNPVFELTKMVQWAYDHEYTDESTIALEYAELARKEVNAKAFVMSNSQAKYVKDCATMVRHYKRAEMKRMSMSEWIMRRCKRVPYDKREDRRGWRAVVQFLRRQEIEFAVFAGAMNQWLKGTPKRNCLVLQGAPDTGKSLFAMSLIRFLGGAVASFVNSKSQFWLQPLAHTKVALIDDATKPFWDYCDTYLRTAFDGNPVSIDMKHRAPVELKFPPLLITTNVAVKEDTRWHYLHSRIRAFTFPTGVHIRDGSTIEDSHWRSFFLKFWKTLDLSDQEEEEEEEEEERDPLITKTDGGHQAATALRFARRRDTRSDRKGEHRP